MDTNLHIIGGQDARALAAPTRLGSEARTGGRPAELRLAVLDSDSGFLKVLGRRLELAGWHHQVLSGRPSARRVASLQIDALVVDVALLGDGRVRWLRSLCVERPGLAVLVCTASSTVAERVVALRAGVDDWLSKPCHPEELVARLEAATLRRHKSRNRLAGPVTVGEIEIRHDQFQAFVGDAGLGLTRREYQLLSLLCQAQGEVLSRAHIYESLWGFEMLRNDRSVDVFVHKLRRKIERCSPSWAYIHTHFGVGYRLHAVPLAAPEQIAA